MKKNENVKKTKDLRFIIVVVLAIVLFTVVSFLSPNNREIPVTPGDLPTEEVNNVNKLIISEILSNNDGFYYTSEGNNYDYIELYNGKDADIDISGYGLSDSDDMVKWAFPEGTVISAKGYLVVALTGENKEGLYANFKLKSSGGETVILVNGSKKVIDAVETVNTNENQPMCRDGNGNWFVCEYPTPGQPNTEAGLEQYLLSIKGEEENKLVINEFLCKNAGNYVNDNGRMDGYIEFKNISDEPVSLKEYSISNDIHVPFKKMLPDVTLQPNEIYTLYSGKADFMQNNYLGFSLDNKAGNVILSHNGVIVENQQYSGLPNGKAMVRMDNGSYESTAIISPGYENTADGIEQFQKSIYSLRNGLIINEVMSNNGEYLAQNGNRYYDWIELYNNSDEEINLSGYNLSTVDTLNEYALPDVTLGAHQYIVFMCSGDTALTNQSYYHTNYKISNEESIYLSKDGKIVDSMFVADVPYGYSYGVGSDGGLYYFDQPTPHEQNGTGKRSIAFKPVFETANGVYNNVSSLSVKIDGQGTIYYTTDGSYPTTSSKVYSGPITLNDTTVVRAICADNGRYSSEAETASYIINENNTLPVMSVSLSPYNFAYLNDNSYLYDLDLACNAEFFEESGSFNVECAISCFGGNSRTNDKKSYALKFDDCWGVKNLVYPLFDNRDNSVYESLVLRTGSNDWTRTIFRDIMATSLSDDFLDVQAYKSCVLYINGEYWGIYNIREKVNKAFISEHYNVSKDSVNIVNVDFTVKEGSNEDLLELINYCYYHDLSNDAYYDYVCTKLDVINVCDYWISEMFCVNPDVYNVRYFNSSELDGGKWKYIYYDMDHAFRFPDYNYYTQYLCNPNGMEGWIENVYDNTIPRALFRNAKFRELWLERLAYHLNNTFTKDKLNEALNHFIDLYEGEIQRDRRRWYGSYDEASGTYVDIANYNSQIAVIKNFINVRSSYILQQTKYYFGLSDTRMKEIFGDLW